MSAIGIDLGTTTLCAAVYEGEHLLSIQTVDHRFISHSLPYEFLQDPDLIATQIIELCDDLLTRFPTVKAIGLTGQMHGIIYLDQKGDAISPLYTWQDQTSAQLDQTGTTYSQSLEDQTGLVIPPGYGLATVYAHHCQGKIPNRAASICTIADYCAMKLCGRTSPLVHITQAASLGAVDLQTHRFKWDILQSAGFPVLLLPEITADYVFAGTFNNIPVAVSIGDNQASFAGTVETAVGSILVNVGTGSQVSIWAADPLDVPHLEARPYIDGHFLLVGAALCGGRAFAALADFFSQVLQMTGVNSGSLYPFMDQVLSQNPYPENPMQIDTRFMGTRDEDNITGSITGITLENLTPAHLMWGVLDGMVTELYNMAAPLLSDREKAAFTLVASGNGVRRNPALLQRLETIFAMPALVSEVQEEAARGCARFALMCLNHCAGR